MKAVLLVSLVGVLIASSAAGRERVFRTPDPAPHQPITVSTLCTFKAVQVSGYRARAGERKICYYDCQGSQTAITVPAGGYCAEDRALSIHGRVDSKGMLARRTRALADFGDAVARSNEGRH
jgi:hypothetical protein